MGESLPEELSVGRTSHTHTEERKQSHRKLSEMANDAGEKSPQNESMALTTKGSIHEKQPDTGAICLKPKMSLLNGITVIVGSIIGSGIFVSPKGVSKGTGSVGLSLVVWISSGVFSLVGAYCYAELGCMITKTGADYAYIMESFGPFVAFLRLWVECMIVRPCSQAIVALTFSFYVLRPIYPDCEPPDTAIRFLACVCICNVFQPYQRAAVAWWQSRSRELQLQDQILPKIRRVCVPVSRQILFGSNMLPLVLVCEFGVRAPVNKLVLCRSLEREFQPRYRPSHLTEVQNYEVRPKIALVLV
ncbi:Y+L amino acid transporter 2 [Araneus ventricosus]|uniref:Y+L amino acid transporter 2 n=1 Tax=Araneus ventricosus TaxID=182803 RepID=A0A4Y2LKH3_ARAVE|nr:Y+L amino acid transporter 2 [Araneus ventricosus]